MIKTVIFDFGGVVAHFIREGAVRRFEQLGLADADSQLDHYCQNGIFLELESGAITAEGFRARLSEMCGREVSHDEARWAWLGFFTETPTAKLDYIAALRPRYRTYVLSNTNPYIMSWARSAELSEQGRPLDDYFDEAYRLHFHNKIRSRHLFGKRYYPQYTNAFSILKNNITSLNTSMDIMMQKLKEKQPMQQ